MTKNYIDEILEEFDEKQFLGISHGGFMANNRKEENKAISNFFKQKLQEVELRKVEEVRIDLETLRDTISKQPLHNKENIVGYKFAINKILTLKSLTNKE